MEDARTPGKIAYHADGDANHYSILDAEGHWLLSLLHNGRQVTARQEANFRRIAACWNACEGISTEDLETDPTVIAKRQALRAAGYQVGDRDPLVHPGLVGRFMVKDTQDPDGIAIVGDDLSDLIMQAYNLLH